MSKSERKLRSGTRKDYEKLADVDGDITDSEGFSDETNIADEGKQKQQTAIMDGQILDSEIAIHGNTDDDDGASSQSDELSEPDDDIVRAQEKLLVIKREKKKLAKKAKLDRIARETEEAQKLLEKLKKQKKTKTGKKKKVNVESLREMEDVVVKVDKLMDKELKLGKKKVTYSSSSSSDSGSSSESDSDDSVTDVSSNSEPEKKKKGKKHEAKKNESKESRKRRSGKSKKLTSDVRYPQKWPHSLLSLHFVNKGKKYEDLTISEFCAGYATILERSSKVKMGHRVTHLKELMYLSTKYQWKCVLNFHAACLLEIERGHLQWGDSFQSLQSTTLAGGFLNANRFGNAGSGTGASGRSSGAGGQNSGTGKSEGTVFCRGFQRGVCKHAQDHNGYFNGENRMLKHICAKCWLKSRTIATHPETSDNCPLKDEP